MYKLIKGGVKNLDTGACIPEGGSIYWQEYLEWVAEGNTPEPEFTEEELKTRNQAAALESQRNSLQMIMDDDARVANGATSLLSAEDRQSLLDYIQSVEDDIFTPSTDTAYNPPLPPGVSPPTFKGVKVLVERVAGWQGNLGWKATISAIADTFVPTNLAVAWYTSANCTGYVGTTGAFVNNGGVWSATCPAGFEPGDVDIHLGLLYGAAQLSCFSLSAGEMSKNITAYEG